MGKLIYKLQKIPCNIEMFHSRDTCLDALLELLSFGHILLK